MKIATRKSFLALYQAEMAKKYFAEQGVLSEFLAMETSGDRKSHPLFSGKGMFIKELQNYLIQGRADIAVHSLKDLPVLPIPPLALFALLPRASKEDVLIISPRVLEESGLKDLSDEKRAILTFEELKKFLYKSEFFKTGPIGTSSLRRTLLIKQHFGENLHCQTLRGNINSRLERARSSEYACIVLARAGLERLNLFTTTHMFILDPKVFVPSAGQGIVAVEACLNENTSEHFKEVCSKISSVSASIEAGIERTVLYLLGSDCYTPVGVYFDGKTVFITTEVNSQFLSCQIDILSEELENIQNLLTKHNNFYAHFFTELCKSPLAEKLKRVLIEKKFIEE